MSIKARTLLKTWFETGKYPEQSQFADWIDSFFHKTEDTIEMESINGLQEALDSKQSVVGTENPNEIQEIEVPGAATIVTAPVDTFGLAIITTSMECGDLRLPISIYIPNNGLWYKDENVMEVPELEDFEITVGVIDGRVNIIITFASAPGNVTIKKPQIQYF
jgi:hypothetical protein